MLAGIFGPFFFISAIIFSGSTFDLFQTVISTAPTAALIPPAIPTAPAITPSGQPEIAMTVVPSATQAHQNSNLFPVLVREFDSGFSVGINKNYSILTLDSSPIL